MELSLTGKMSSLTYNDRLADIKFNFKASKVVNQQTRDFTRGGIYWRNHLILHFIV